MDEYTPKHYDIAQLRFLCENLCDESIATLGDSSHGWVNDPTSAINLQLNELIEHIATFILTFKIKYPNESELSEQVEKYLDDTYVLFSNYGINDAELRRWQKSKSKLFGMFSGENVCTPAKT
ncbi:Hha toxicity modulator TomB [Pectobacterium sp. CFBP8739]|uniref:Hha toxicity modulator TomB n=1 Tax=Pectobacterium TaxID=122277 RepID=UPI0015DE669C|nr:Hha toxicity modulator TomB [Pectobacterium sp. CFBP8739]MBA0167560.1 Hha toxicity modulator TomB [Pectobacterium sp. CFBP8739]